MELTPRPCPADHAPAHMGYFFAYLLKVEEVAINRLFFSIAEVWF
jgi:hypothetical protein